MPSDIPEGPHSIKILDEDTVKICIGDRATITFEVVHRFGQKSIAIRTGWNTLKIIPISNNSINLELG